MELWHIYVVRIYLDEGVTEYMVLKISLKGCLLQDFTVIFIYIYTLSYKKKFTSLYNSEDFSPKIVPSKLEFGNMKIDIFKYWYCWYIFKHENDIWNILFLLK